MTLHVVDVSRHQVERPDPLDLATAKTLGFGAVNIQLDRGRQTDVLPAWAPEYADRARSLGLGVSAYRWLDNRIPGAESARRAFERMHQLGGPGGMAHAVDCEDNATQQHLRDYVTTMTGLLGRPISIYSGSWWMKPRGWQVADLSPYLWSAPVAGYLKAYPGDQSPHWMVAYGGHQHLSVMQYAVQPLPGTGDCSLSAIRDLAVWAALTGGGSMTVAPADLRAVRNYLIAELDMVPGVARGSDLEANEVGIVGDPAHAATGGYHEGNDDLARVGRLTSDYSKRQSARDRPGSNAASAIDIGSFDVTKNGRRISLRTLSAAVDAACRRKDPRTRDVREWIWSPDGTRVVRWDALGLQDTGDISHRWHSHGSFFRDSEGRRDDPDNFLGLLREIIEGDDMAQEDIDRMNWLAHSLENLTPTVEGGPVKGRPFKTAAALDEIKDLLTELKDAGTAPVPVTVDAAAVAAALGTDTAFLAAVAKAVNDDAAKRGAE